MKNIFKRWKSKKTNAPINKEPIAGFHLTIYPDGTQVEIFGREENIGGALVSLMLDNPFALQVMSKSVMAVRDAQEQQAAIARLMTTIILN